jgi:hypothetical protein
MTPEEFKAWKAELELAQGHAFDILAFRLKRLAEDSLDPLTCALALHVDFVTKKRLEGILRRRRNL